MCRQVVVRLSPVKKTRENLVQQDSGHEPSTWKRKREHKTERNKRTDGEVVTVAVHLLGEDWSNSRTCRGWPWPPRPARSASLDAREQHHRVVPDPTRCTYARELARCARQPSRQQLWPVRPVLSCPL
jgi:hypothetical protein